MNKPLILDSSALLADIKNESGATAVRSLMSDAAASNGIFMHSINVCEVAYNLIKSGIPEQYAFVGFTSNGNNH